MVDQAQREAFVVALAKLRGSAGNGRLRDALGWDEATYEAVKEDRVRGGAVTAGRGRGGSVTLASALAGRADLTVEDFSELPASPRALSEGSAPAKSAKSNDGPLGFEAELIKAADKLRGNMEPSDYKHVALGLIFLKHISETFETKRAELLLEDLTVQEGTKVKPSEDRDEYAAESVFWVPPTERRRSLQRPFPLAMILDWVGWGRPSFPRAEPDKGQPPVRQPGDACSRIQPPLHVCRREP
jgi:type I restriction enzyme M protein